MSNERQINYVNEIQNRAQNLYYVDDASELNSIDLKENDKIYAINDNKLFQMEIVDQDEELSGSIVSFNGRNNTKIKSVVANIEPIQDLHGYDKPWPAGGGKNLIPKIGENNTYVGVSVSYDSDAEIYTLNGTVNAIGNISFAIIPKDNLNWVENESYTISCRVISGNFTIPSGSGNTYALSIFNSKNLQFIRGAVNLSESGLDGYSATGNAFTTTSRFTVMFQAFRSGITFNNLKVKIQIEKGSTATTWNPYENICPISGWTGANIPHIGKNLVQLTDSMIATIPDGATPASVGKSAYKVSLPAGTYVMRFNGSTVEAYVYAECFNGGTWQEQLRLSTAAANPWLERSVTFTSNGDIYIYRATSGSLAALKDCMLQIERGSAATAYEEYRGTTLPINWQDEAGTIYGGSFTLNEDGSVDIIKINEIVNLSSLTWSIDTSKTYPVFRGDINFESDRVLGHLGVKLCSIYNPISNMGFSAFGNNDYNNRICFNAGISTAYRLMIQDSGCETLTDFESRILGQTAICELATPQTYHISNIGQLQAYLGTNNIWSDIGDITVKIAEKGITAFELEPHI